MQIPTPQDKLAEFDARLSRIEGIVEQLAERMNCLAQGQRDLSNLVEQNRRESRTDFRWLVGIQITTLLTLGTLILFKLG